MTIFLVAAAGWDTSMLQTNLTHVKIYIQDSWTFYLITGLWNEKNSSRNILDDNNEYRITIDYSRYW